MLKLQLFNKSNRYSRIRIQSRTIVFDGIFTDTALIENKAVPDDKMHFNIVLYTEPYVQDFKDFSRKFDVLYTDTTYVTFQY